MIRIKVFKASQLLYTAAVVVLSLLILGLAISFFVGRSAGETSTPQPRAQTVTQSPKPTAEVRTNDLTAGTPDAGVPAVDEPALSFTGPARMVSQWLMDVDPLDPLSVLSYQFPMIEAGAVAVSAETEGEEEIPDTPDDVERIRVEIESITGSYQKPDKQKLRVLIYHTHTYEAFAQDADNPYKETTQWRSADSNFNIVRVGEELKKELEARGIEVVHDRTEHEPPKLGTAYVRSLQTLEGYRDRGETFDMMIDMHRDAASKGNTNPSYVSFDGKQYARLMMLIGTGEGSGANAFSIKPNWKENYKLADALTQALNQEHANICRDVMVKTGRYNQHMSESAVLIEVGHNENTLEQALNSMQPLAQAIAKTLGAQ